MINSAHSQNHKFLGIRRGFSVINGRLFLSLSTCSIWRHTTVVAIVFRKTFTTKRHSRFCICLSCEPRHERIRSTSSLSSSHSSSRFDARVIGVFQTPIPFREPQSVLSLPNQDAFWALLRGECVSLMPPPLACLLTLLFSD